MESKRNGYHENRMHAGIGRRIRCGTPKPARPRTAAAPSPASVAAVDDKASRCEAEKQKYRESEACFAPYRTPIGAIQPEGFQHCIAMNEPTC